MVGGGDDGWWYGGWFSLAWLGRASHARISADIADALTKQSILHKTQCNIQ